MQKFWGTYLLYFGVLAGVCVVAWEAAGADVALTIALLACAALLLNHLSQVRALRNWLQQPAAESVPMGRGVWSDIFGELYRMQRRQRASESQLSASLEDFRQAGAAMPDGLMILNPADRIEWCNPMAEQHFGLDARRDVGQSATFLVRQPQFLAYLRARSYSEPLTLRQSRGADYVLSIQLVPYGNQQKLIISRDITDLERVETMRRDFIANVSHELRTPLTVLGGFLETIAESGAGNADLLRRSLPLMSDQALRMQRLVEDLLTLSRLESSHNPPREEDIDVPRLAHELYREALALSGGRHRLLLDVASSAWLRGAEVEVRSAFSNLISNAVRYTRDDGEITISWRRRAEELSFTVTDSGIGVARQHIPRLTERFYRVDRSRSRESGGTGLGLAIVKHVMSRHQGRLEIDSQPGRGSTFTAVFPASRAIVRDPPGVVARSA